MKVLVYRYQSICEPYVIDAFKAMDIEVIEYTREMTVKDYSPQTAVREIGEFIEKNPVDFVFSINFFPYVAEVCNVYHILYLSWIVDSPVMELFSAAVSRPYNRIFNFDRASCLEITKYNPGNVFHLPLAANVEEKDKLFKETSASVRRKFSHEVAFVGSLYTEKCPYDNAKNIPDNLRGYFDGIMRAQEKVYGYYFIEDLLSDEHVEEFKKCYPGFYALPEGNYLTDKYTLAHLYLGNKIACMERLDTFRALSERFNTSIYTASDTSDFPKLHNMGTAKTLTEMPVIFNQSKINLNITSKAIRTGLPLRIFDILSSGGFLLTNFQEEIPEFFEPGEDLIMYGSIDELLYLTEYYLDHDDERKAIAERGREKVRANYSYKQQLEKMLYTAFKVSEDAS